VLVLGSMCAAPCNGETGSSDIGDVQITGEARDKVKIQKFLPEISVNIPDVVDATTEKTEALLEQGKTVPSEADLQGVPYTISQQAARPYLPDLPTAPLISFYPEPARVPVKRWELVINDDSGEAVAVMRGKGNPVKAVVWDGRTRRKEMAKVGSLYSYKFIVYDRLKNPHTTLGTAFKIDAILYEQKGKLIAEIAERHLFQEDSARFSPEALLTLEKILDVLRARSKYPFTIELYAKDPLGLLIKERKNRLVEHVAEELLLMREDIRFRIDRLGSRGRVVRFVVHQ